MGILYSHVSFLGYIIIQDGVNNKKMKAVTEGPTPQSINGLY